MKPPVSIHLLGAGAMGTLITHTLRRLPTPPITTLLFRSQAKAVNFQTLQNNTFHLKQIHKTPHVVETTTHQASYPGGVSCMIKNLIIATKTNQTIDALTPYLSQIDKNTNILLVQNGFGVAEELCEKIFPDETTRPQLFQGVINHSGFLTPNVPTDRFEMTHSGIGDLFICKIPANNDSLGQQEIGDMPEFINLINQTGDELNCTLLSYSDMLVTRIRKFVSNACSNSITAILDIVNYEIDMPQTKILYSEMIKEMMEVFYASKPILLANPKSKILLDEKTLLDFVMDVTVNWHGKGTTSTRHDTLMGRRTEVEYLTGFVLKEAEKLSIKCDTVRTVTRLVRMREEVNIRRRERVLKE